MKKITVPSLILALALAQVPAFGADTTPMSDAPKDTALERARSAISQKDWTGAQTILREAVAREPRNPDFHNLYAYSNRKSSNPEMSLVFKHYNEALALNPKHRGAHEYIGEAYLMVGNVGKAKEHLAQLDKLCVFSCSEFSDLKNSISAYETKKMAK